MKTIYRIKSYSNKPLAVYDGNQKLGTFRSVEEIKKAHPDAEFKMIQLPKEIGIAVEVDTEIWREFKSLALVNGFKLKSAIAQAIKLWIENEKKKKKEMI